MKKDVPACQKVFAAPWPKTITPLDTCGRVRLTGRKYQAIAGSNQPLARAIIENYRIWQACGGWVKDADASSILFDCVAVYLAFADELVTMQRMRLRVTDDGCFRESSDGYDVEVALAWKDLLAFEDLLVTRLTQTAACSK